MSGVSDTDRRFRTIYAAKIGDDLAGRTVREVLLRYGGVSRSIARRAKREGGIRVNGEEVLVSHTVRPGDVVELRDAVWSDLAIDAEPVPLSIVYEDARLVVVDKPAGILVHPVKKHRSGTVANGLAWLYLSRGEASGIHPIHRLDRGTSGLVLLAKDALTHFELSRQLASRDLTRTYLALVEGVVSADSGAIDSPLEVAPGSFIQRRVASDAESGLSARTTFQVVERMPRHTLLRLSLETGRTHQIRVHLSSAGFPIVGDSLYGAESDLVGRQALHACEISFIHPGHANGWSPPCEGISCDCSVSSRLTFASEPPPEFRNAVDACR